MKKIEKIAMKVMVISAVCLLIALDIKLISDAVKHLSQPNLLFLWLAAAVFGFLNSLAILAITEWYKDSKKKKNK